MFSMNSWVSRESPGTSQESMKFNEFMENIGLANVFHCFFHGNSWQTLAWPMFSMNSWFSKESPVTSQESMKFNEFMENIGLANVFHCFFMEIHGKHWPGQCFP